ncbi:preprotein translocase subunit SecF [Cellulosimicrobium cellulans]|jgi:preprotein translocase subunit SecF|uniref:Protein-export membrane protein SecF n=1 Tax=Cellulosimicrobium cellulans TaxID=1710 RepID=A0A1Y0HYI5_CELCE|nr:protein translocase subunit SecF [Cellulosimicrobium cellulans]ARU53050.1 protein translocase subunit SecF [Cellulosimicrobium cellulans]MBM7819822.1 preprotein translocase subunit SecF [Cellulosimicrobium cellulans]
MAARSFAQWGNDLYTGRKSYPIVQQRKRWFIVVGILSLLSVIVIAVQGLNLGLDFRGGSEFTVTSITDKSQEPAVDAVHSIAPDAEPRVSSVGESALRVQTAELADEDQVNAVRQALADAYGVDVNEVASAFVGPTWGADVSSRALWGVVVFIGLVAVFMAIYFRAWRMSLAAIIALLADLLISAGVYAAVGWEVTPSTIIGFLTILGYSLYDKVVVFDKVRENTAGILDQTRSTYAERANLGVNQTLVRSINTGVVALLPVAGILFIGAFALGAGTLRDISLSLFVGIAVGTASSIFLATPLEVWLRTREPAIAAHTRKVEALRAERLADAGEESDDDAVLAAAGVSGHRQLQPGEHLGNKAQPRRRRPR